MKTFFVSAPRANKLMGDTLHLLYEEIKKMGFSHTSNLITLSSDRFESEMGQGKHAMTDFYRTMVEAINKADICIFEASVSSSGVGFLIDKALSLSKPTVILFYKKEKSYLLPGVDDEKLGIYVYDENNYREVLAQAMDVAVHLRDTRFNFFINPKLLDYLVAVSKKNGMTKSQFIRSLILEHMKKRKSK